MAFRSHIAVLRFLDQGRLQMPPGAIWSEFPILENNKTKTMDATDSQDMIPFREPVRTEWIDYNGHMNLAYYVLVFDHATDDLLDHIGMDEAFRDANGGSVFVVEAHVTYENEALEGDDLSVTTQVLDFDAKRMHVFHRMTLEGSDETIATNELMILYVDMKTRRSAPIPRSILGKLNNLRESQKSIPKPKQAGRSIGIRRKA